MEHFELAQLTPYLNKFHVNSMTNVCIQLCFHDRSLLSSTVFRKVLSHTPRKEKKKGMSMSFTLTCDVRTPPLSHVYVGMEVGVAQCQIS